jgi:hypothetical protein
MILPRSLAVLALTSLAGASVGSAQILFSDNFTTSGQSNDINFEHTGGRQSGTLGTIQWRQGVGNIGANISGAFTNESFGGYQTQIGNAGGPGKLWLVGAGSAGDGDQVATASPEFNFNVNAGVGGYLSIRFELDPVTGAAGTNGDWGAITIGSSDRSNYGVSGSGARGQDITNAAVGFGVLLRDNGGYQAFSGGAGVGSGTYSATPATPTTHAIELRIYGVGDGNAFDGSGDASIELHADGSIAATFTRAGGFTDNFITLMGYSGGFQINAFDNFQVEAVPAVPEPSSFALLAGMAALSIGASRRRRRG